jgi:cytochrome oxidase Cu insertion factor (SCO1/SenC/PrrC family)
MLLFAGCTGTARPPQNPAPVDAWRDVALTDVTTGETFSLSSFSGRPVVLFTFTVSCPICTQQQKEISALERNSNGSIAVVGLDIDPNEEPGILQSHIQKNGFSGHYAISPPEMTRALVDRFGPAVVTPSSAPVMVICPNGNADILDAGIKPSSLLSSSISAVC